MASHGETDIEKIMNEARLFEEEDLFTILFAAFVGKSNVKCLMFKKNLVRFAAKKMDYEYKDYGMTGMGIQRVANHVAFVGDLPLVNFIIANSNHDEFYSHYLHADRRCTFKINNSLDHEINVPEIIEHASLSGQIGMIKHLTKGRPDKSHVGATVNAAAGGHLDLLEYLHSDGYPWIIDSSISYDFSMTIHDAVSYATKFGHLHVVKYLVEHGCPMLVYALWAARSRGYKEIETYLLQNNCPTRDPYYCNYNDELYENE